MPVTTLTDTMPSSASVASKAVRTAVAAEDFPHRSTRQLEAVFAKRRDRRSMIGIGIAVGFSLAVWGGLAFLLI